MGCAWAVWSEYVQPLVELKQWLHEGGTEEKEEERDWAVIEARLHENWLREHQVLPLRTHPMVNMKHLGGYILSGYKVRKRPTYPTTHTTTTTHTKETEEEVGAPSSKKRKVDEAD